MKNAAKIIFTAVLFGIDQWLKGLAVHGAQTRILFFDFRLYKNPGLVFSLPAPMIVILIVTIVAILAVGLAIWKRRHESMMVWCAALFVGGAASNLLDRVTRGFVVDYVYVGDWAPIVNIADMMLFVSLLMIIWPHKKLTTETPPVS